MMKQFKPLLAIALIAAITNLGVIYTTPKADQSKPSVLSHIDSTSVPRREATHQALSNSQEPSAGFHYASKQQLSRLAGDIADQFYKWPAFSTAESIQDGRLTVKCFEEKDGERLAVDEFELQLMSFLQQQSLRGYELVMFSSRHTLVDTFISDRKDQIQAFENLKRKRQAESERLAQKRKEDAESLAQERKANAGMAAKRREFASELEDRYLNDEKLDTHVSTSGLYGKCLEIHCVLMGRVMANEMMKSNGFVDQIRALGFTSVRFFDGYQFEVVYKLE